MYVHARTRKGFGLGRAFCLENKTTSARILENKTRAFHRCLENKTRVGMKKRSTGFFSVVILKAANGRWLSCLCIHTHTRERWLRSFSFGCLIRKNSFFLFFLSFIYFLSFCLFFSVKVNSFLFLFLKKSKY